MKLSSKPNAEMIDNENPEWTDEMFASASRGRDILPKLIKRGKQKTSTKQLTTIRFSPEVLEYFKATGKGWQTRIDAVLKEYITSH